MATKRPSPTVVKEQLELSVPRDDAKQRLQDRVVKGMELMQRQVDSAEAYEVFKRESSKWDDFNSELLKRLFTTEELAREYSYTSSSSISFGMYDPTLGQEIASSMKDVESKVHCLDSIIERLELIPLRAGEGQGVAVAAASSAVTPTKKVFVVHGHDDAAKTNLEVFLNEIGLEPVVLHRQADQGLTVIEKFEKHSDVGYAFILLTADEIAYLASEETKPDAERQKERRARPNVIFEFGYFVGKLGRSRVCCLYTGGVTLPSDLAGLIYKKYEKSIEEVAYPIIKDLKASGYTVG